jgi:hypothetical protein
MGVGVKSTAKESNNHVEFFKFYPEREDTKKPIIKKLFE